MREPTPIKDMSSAEILRERFDLEAAFASTPSASGYQLEAAQTRILGEGHNGARADTQEWKRIRLMDLLKATNGVEREDIDVCRLRYRTLAATKPYEKNRLRADLRDGDGEEIIGSVLDKDGKPIEGWVRVRGVSVRPASRSRVLEHLEEQGTPLKKHRYDQIMASAHARIDNQKTSMGDE